MCCLLASPAQCTSCNLEPCRRVRCAMVMGYVMSPSHERGMWLTRKRGLKNLVLLVGSGWERMSKNHGGHICVQEGLKLGRKMSAREGSDLIYSPLGRN